MRYTDYTTPELSDQFFCARVSHHHFWFDTYSEMLDFMNNDKLADPRMYYCTPATYQSPY